MQTHRISQTDKAVEAYHGGHITLTELVEELEWYWEMKIHMGTEKPVLEIQESR